MTTQFISRHAGAREWAKQEGIKIDYCVEHFDVNDAKKQDVVIGTLPVNLVCEVNLRVVVISIFLLTSLQKHE